MKKRTLFTSLGAAVAAAAPLAAVISCTSNTTYKVVIDNTKDKNYVIAIPDINYQPVPYSNGGTIYWDISSDFKSAKYNKALNAFFKNDSSKVILATKTGKPYKNGFEWFIYEILKAKDHGIDLQLPLNNKKDISLDSNFKSDKAIDKLISLFEQKGKDLLKIEKAKNASSTKTASDMIDKIIGIYNTYANTNSKNSLGATWSVVKSKFVKGNTTFKGIKTFVDLFNQSIDSHITNSPTDNIAKASKISWDYKVPVFSIPKDIMKKDATNRATHLKSRVFEFINAFWNVELVQYDQTNDKFVNQQLSKPIFDKAVDDMLKKVKE